MACGRVLSPARARCSATRAMVAASGGGSITGTGAPAASASDARYRTAPSPMMGHQAAPRRLCHRAGGRGGVADCRPFYRLERPRRARAANIVEGGEHLVPLGIHPDAEAPVRRLARAAGDRQRQRLQRRHPDDRPPGRERAPLDGGDADAQPGEGAGADRHRKHVDVGEAGPGPFERPSRDRPAYARRAGGRRRLRGGPARGRPGPPPRCLPGSSCRAQARAW